MNVEQLKKLNELLNQEMASITKSDQASNFNQIFMITTKKLTDPNGEVKFTRTEKKQLKIFLKNVSKNASNDNKKALKSIIKDLSRERKAKFSDELNEGIVFQAIDSLNTRYVGKENLLKQVTRGEVGLDSLLEDIMSKKDSIGLVPKAINFFNYYTEQLVNYYLKGEMPDFNGLNDSLRDHCLNKITELAGSVDLQRVLSKIVSDVESVDYKELMNYVYLINFDGEFSEKNNTLKDALNRFKDKSIDFESIIGDKKAILGKVFENIMSGSYDNELDLKLANLFGPMLIKARIDMVMNGYQSLNLSRIDLSNGNKQYVKDSLTKMYSIDFERISERELETAFTTDGARTAEAKLKIISHYIDNNSQFFSKNKNELIEQFGSHFRIKKQKIQNFINNQTPISVMSEEYTNQEDLETIIGYFSGRDEFTEFIGMIKDTGLNVDEYAYSFNGEKKTLNEKQISLIRDEIEANFVGIYEQLFTKAGKLYAESTLKSKIKDVEFLPQDCQSSIQDYIIDTITNIFYPMIDDETSTDNPVYLVMEEMLNEVTESFENLESVEKKSMAFKEPGFDVNDYSDIDFSINYEKIAITLKEKIGPIVKKVKEFTSDFVSKVESNNAENKLINEKIDEFYGKIRIIVNKINEKIASYK